VGNNNRPRVYNGYKIRPMFKRIFDIIKKAFCKDSTESPYQNHRPIGGERL